MSNLAKLPLRDDQSKTSEGGAAYRCVVEAPRGSSVKFKYDPELKAFVMGHELIKGLTYPFDWGFFPSTLGADGDPLDVMIFHDAPSASGIVIPSQVIGVLEVEQSDVHGERLRNDRFFAVPVKSHREDSLNHVDQLSKRMRDELVRFFEVASSLEDKKLHVIGWKGPKVAHELLKDGVERLTKK